MWILTLAGVLLILYEFWRRGELFTTLGYTSVAVTFVGLITGGVSWVRLRFLVSDVLRRAAS